MAPRRIINFQGVNNAVIAGRLKESRTYVGMSPIDVEKALNIRVDVLDKIENGSLPVSKDQLLKFSALYGCTTEVLLGSDRRDHDTTEMPAFLARAVHGLNSSDCAEVSMFAEFLRNSSAQHQD